METEQVHTHHTVKSATELTTPMAIIVAGILIAGSILLGFSWVRTEKGGTETDTPTPTTTATPPVAVTANEPLLGNPNAKLTLVLYADFQCPFCGRFFSETEQQLNTTYVKDGKLAIVYRDFTFLGPESLRASEAARCAGDQGKFWEYHDYLFTHQDGENKGHFADANLKSFSKELNLNTTTFNSCFDSSKYEKAVQASTQEGSAAGVQGTPKGFIFKNGKVVDTIDGAEALAKVTAKIDKALK